jgi:hypothetical protein
MIYTVPININYAKKQYCASGMFMPDPGSEFFHPGSRSKRSTSKNLSILI